MNATQDTVALRCRGLVHVYRVSGTDVAALRGIDLVVDAGQRMALLGPSGSGKSTLLSVVAGIMRPSAGRVEVFGTDLGTANAKTMRHVRADALGLMLQGAATNLLLYDDAQGNVDYAITGAERGDRAVADAVLRSEGLDGDRRPVGLLSPSEQQVVALAVAMATRPRLLLMDEPTSRLDDAARDRLLDLMLGVTTEHGTAALVVTHDPQVAERMDRVIHLRDGRIAEEATSTGRYAVIGADGALQLPDAALKAGWAPGSLVDVEVREDGTLRLSRIDPD